MQGRENGKKLCSTQKNVSSGVSRAPTSPGCSPSSHCLPSPGSLSPDLRGTAGRAGHVYHVSLAYSRKFAHRADVERPLTPPPVTMVAGWTYQQLTPRSWSIMPGTRGTQALHRAAKSHTLGQAPFMVCVFWIERPSSCWGSPATIVPMHRKLHGSQDLLRSLEPGQGRRPGAWHPLHRWSGHSRRGGKARDETPSA